MALETGKEKIIRGNDNNAVHDGTHKVIVTLSTRIMITQIKLIHNAKKRNGLNNNNAYAVIHKLFEYVL